MLPSSLRSCHFAVRLLLRVGNYKLLNKIIVFINVFTHVLHFLDSISSQCILVPVFLYAAEFY